jgi:tryptophanyl-tRNA synthetase
MGSEGERAEFRAKMEKSGTGYGDLKKMLAEMVLKEFGPLRKRREELAADSKKVARWMEEGAAKARTTAEGVLARVRAAVGTKS